MVNTPFNTNNSRFIGVHLFSYSNNMLYPKEDKENKVLLYAVSILTLFDVFSSMLLKKYWT